jgi:hypothetical protein
MLISFPKCHLNEKSFIILCRMIYHANPSGSVKVVHSAKTWLLNENGKMQGLSWPEDFSLTIHGWDGEDERWGWPSVNVKTVRQEIQNVWPFDNILISDFYWRQQFVLKGKVLLGGDHFCYLLWQRMSCLYIKDKFDGDNWKPE